MKQSDLRQSEVSVLGRPYSHNYSRKSSYDLWRDKALPLLQMLVWFKRIFTKLLLINIDVFMRPVELRLGLLTFVLHTFFSTVGICHGVLISPSVQDSLSLQIYPYHRLQKTLYEKKNSPIYKFITFIKIFFSPFIILPLYKEKWPLHLSKTQISSNLSSLPMRSPCKTGLYYHLWLEIELQLIVFLATSNYNIMIAFLKNQEL